MEQQADRGMADNAKRSLPLIDERFAMLEQLYRTAPVGLCLIGPDLRYLHINERLAAIHGCTVESNIGSRVRDVIPELADRVELVLQQVLDTGAALLDIDFEGKQLTDPGVDAWWRASFHPVRDEDHKVCGVSVVVQDITDLRLKERALEERARFEKIFSELSTLLISLPAAEIDGKIEEALALVGRFMDVDRCAVLQFSDDKTEFRITHMWLGEHVPADELGPSMQLCETMPWFSSNMLNGRTLIEESLLDALPDEAVAEKAYCEQIDLQSTALVPLMVGEDVIGTFGFDMIGRKRKWPEDMLQRLQLASEIFASALLRQRNQAQIDELSRFERKISEVSSRFVNLTADRVDSAIEQALGDIGACLGTELGTLLLWDAGKGAYLVSHEWRGVANSESPSFKGIYVDDDFRWLATQLEKREPLFIDNLAQWPAAAATERAACEQVGIESVLWVPFDVAGDVQGYVALNSLSKPRKWTEAFIQRLRLVGEIFGNALLRKRSEKELQDAFQRISTLKDRLESENVYLRTEVETRHKHKEIIGESRAIRRTLMQVEQVAPTDSTVLLIGETGTGKELMARAVHELSERKDRAMVTVNCGALPATLIEAELFGREKGAYTGALTRQTGRFELADGSTVFLDEIGELPPELQIRLLRVLQDGTFERLGGNRTLQVDVRVIAATNRDLAEEVRKGNFREDLYYRLNVFPVSMPPLRERSEDIPLLVWAFIKEFGKTMGKQIERIPVEEMERLQRYSWPGNIRELRNVIERAMILATGNTLHIEQPAAAPVDQPAHTTLEDVERAHIEKILARQNGRIGGRQGAAQLLGLKPTTLRSRMDKLGIPFRKQRDG